MRYRVTFGHVSYAPTRPAVREHAARPYAILALGLALVCALAACGNSAAPKAKGTATSVPTLPPSPTATPLPDGWSLAASPAVGQEGRLLAVAADAPNDAWAVGQYEGADSLQRTLVEHWGGRQWAYVNSPNPGARDNILQGVAADSPSDAWAVGSQMSATGVSQPLVEHWNGSAWSVATIPGAGSLGGRLTGIAAIAPTDVWAVGSYVTISSGQGPSSPEQPLALHWNGAQWQSVPVPSPATGSFEYLSAVAAVSSRDVWAAGSDSAANTSLIEHWNGTAWKIVAAPTAVNGGALTGLAAIASGDVWAVGTGSGTLRQGGCGVVAGAVIEHWDGTRWSDVAAPTITSSGGTQGQAPPFSLAGVAAASAHNVWAVGSISAYMSDQSGAYSPVILHWDGTSWTQAQAPTALTAEGLVGVAAISSGSVWSVGQYEGRNGPATSLITQETGGGWTIVPSPSPGTLANSLAGVAAITPNDAWAVGSSADGTLTEHWNGAGWSNIPSADATAVDNRLNAVTAVSSSDVWAVGAAWDSQQGTQSLAEHWNGATWTVTPGPSPATASARTAELRAVAAISSGDVWAGGVAGSPLLERWNGSAWDITPSPTAINGTNLDAFGINGIAAVSSKDVWAVGGNTARSCAGIMPALIEHWDGTRWTATVTSQTGILYGVTAVSATDVWAVGTSFASGPQGALMLHWDGKQWSQVPVPAPVSQQQSYQLRAVAARAAGDVFAAGVAYDFGGSSSGPQSRALVERWNGTSWSIVQVPQPGLEDNALAAIATLPATHGDVWTVGTYDDCGYYACYAQQALIAHFAG